MSSRRVSDAEIDASFHARISQRPGPLETQCWIWTGTLRSDGYGIRTIHRKCWSTHRWAFHRWNGPIPNGALICHKCDVRACCNPEHLYAGTKRTNAIDAVARGQMMTGKRWYEVMAGKTPHGEGHCCARLTEDDVRWIIANVGKRGHKAAGKRFGVNRKTIADVVYGKSWKHIPRPIPTVAL